MEFNKDIKLKIKTIIENYIRGYPEEFAAFRKQQKLKRASLANKWAEIKGSDIMIRELNEYPETLFTLIKMGLSDSEHMEFRDEKLQFWVGNQFPDLKITEGKL